MNVTGVNSFKNSQNKSSVNNTHKVTSPSFGFRFKARHKRAFAVLPAARRDACGQELMDVFAPTDPSKKITNKNLLKKLSDDIERKYYKEGKAILWEQRKEKIINLMNSFFGSPPKKAA